MFKPLLYLDTTVPSAFFDERTPERQSQTVAFWTSRLPDFVPVISDVVIREVENTPDLSKRNGMMDLIGGFTRLKMDEAAEKLAQTYLKHKVFSSKDLPDAQHVAVAVNHKIGYLVSWNFKHLVKIKTRREINLINALQGLEPIEIVAPPEL